MVLTAIPEFAVIDAHREQRTIHRISNKDGFSYSCSISHLIPPIQQLEKQSHKGNIMRPKLLEMADIRQVKRERWPYQ